MVLAKTCGSVADCFREYSLGFLCLATFIVFAVALARLSRVPHVEVPVSDTCILVLSALQCLLGFAYYGLVEGVEIILACRALKVLQCVALCWVFVLGIGGCEWRRAVNLSASTVVGFFSLLYLIIVFVWKPEDGVCRDAAWLLLSGCWLLFSAVVAVVGVIYLRHFAAPPTPSFSARCPLPLKSPVHPLELSEWDEGDEDDNMSTFDFLPLTPPKENARRDDQLGVTASEAASDQQVVLGRIDVSSSKSSDQLSTVPFDIALDDDDDGDLPIRTLQEAPFVAATPPLRVDSPLLSSCIDRWQPQILSSTAIARGALPSTMAEAFLGARHIQTLSEGCDASGAEYDGDRLYLSVDGGINGTDKQFVSESCHHAEPPDLFHSTRPQEIGRTSSSPLLTAPPGDHGSLGARSVSPFSGDGDAEGGDNIPPSDLHSSSDASPVSWHPISPHTPDSRALWISGGVRNHHRNSSHSLEDPSGIGSPGVVESNVLISKEPPPPPRDSQPFVVDILGRRSVEVETELGLLVPHREEGRGLMMSQYLSPLPAPQVTIALDNSASSLVITKRKRLLVLILIEAFSAVVTFVWDVVLLAFVDSHPQTSCEYFLSHIPFLELVAYILMRTISSLLPHWAVFYVFYWVERRLYAPLRSEWDVDLAGVETLQMS